MIVFPMAGLSNRFRRAGYEKPKYMLDLGGRTVFSHAVSGFSRFFDTEPFLFICRSEAATPAFIEAELKTLHPGLRQHEIVVLEAETSGQAETVDIGLRLSRLDHSDSLTIFNIDTFRPGYRRPPGLDLATVDGYLEVVRADGEGWSFVRPEDPDRPVGRAVEVAEKVRISDLCSTGLYYFRTADLFLDLYDLTVDKKVEDLQGGERYVAPLYNLAIAAGRRIFYELIEPHQVVFCGTPEEYESLRRSAVARVPDR
ncbi:glycosyltransferase family 2 protein [Microbaculum marinum]|uniref:Glycosyltransferase family 2 protein n=1 Tax=Microbaculum marinum TaxID=1764581 RepID=A0AAW9RSJ6_9HYPH